MKSGLFTLFLGLGLSFQALAQPCIPPAPATVIDTIPGTPGTYTLTDVPTGVVLQLDVTSPGTVFFFDMCATNTGTAVPSGTNDSRLTLLDVNDPGANVIDAIDDGCANMDAPGYGPTYGSFTIDAVGTYFVYLTEWDPTGADGCIADGLNSVYDFSISVCIPPTIDLTSYGCATDGISVDITDLGGTASGAPFQVCLSGDTSTNQPAVLTLNGFYGLSPDQSYYILIDDGTGTCAVASPIVSAAPCYLTPPSCTDTIVVDGEFEQGSGNAWDETFVDLAGDPVTFNIVLDVFPLEGAQAAWFGGIGGGSVSTLTQLIDLPAGGYNSVDLSFWGFADLCDSPLDSFNVLIDNVPVATIMTATNGNCGNNTYHRYEYSLNGITEGEHELKLVYFQDDASSGAQGFWVDNLKLTYCGYPVGITPTGTFAGIDINPNPTQGMLQVGVSLNQSEEVSLSVVDINGTLVQSINGGLISQQMYSLDLRDAAPGVYFVRITAGDATEVRKVVKI